jgi:hypothetical protein
MPVIDRRRQPLSPDHPFATPRVFFGMKKPVPPTKPAPPADPKVEQPAEPPTQK